MFCFCIAILYPVFPLRKFYAEQIFDLVSMDILMLSLNELPTLWTQFGNRWSRSLIKNEQITHLIQTVSSCFRGFPMFIHFIYIYCWIFVGSWFIIRCSRCCNDGPSWVGPNQCLSTGCIVHPRVYQNFPGVYHRGGMYRGIPDVYSIRTVTLSLICPVPQRSVPAFHRF